MKKLFLFILLFYSFVNTQTYDIGDIISTTHQNQSFDVCYGDYFSNNFHFSDLNGAINESGTYYITFVRVNHFQIIIIERNISIILIE